MLTDSYSQDSNTVINMTSLVAVAKGKLGGCIIKALLAHGATGRALVRAVTDSGQL